MTHGPALLASASRVPGLSLELRTDTQSATAYLHGRPFATVQRGGSEANRHSAWTVRSVGGYSCGVIAHRGAERAVDMVERWAAWALALALTPGAACVVTLAPDYDLRSDLRLVMARARGRTGRAIGWTLAGYVPGHMFLRLRYLGGDAPTFRRQADLAEWCALVGLTAAAPILGRRGCYRFGDALQAASPVATTWGAGA